jgi:hypothetical protein
MKRNILTCITIIVATLLSVPVIAGANAVSWTSENYRAYTYAYLSEMYFPEDQWGQIDEEKLSPPLAVPLSASAYSEYTNPVHLLIKSWGDAVSNVSSSTFYVSADTQSYASTDGHAHAIASFTGSFSASDPYFEFSYDLSTAYSKYDFGTPTSYVPSYDGWLTVESITSGTTLLDTSLSAGTDSVLVALPAGHDINVSFGIEAFSDYPAYYRGGATREATLSFNTSVVPEPISSILFIAGGTLLAGRRYIRKDRT